MRQISLCFIGCGGHAHRVYADSLKKYNLMNEEVRLVACCDVNKEKADSFQAAVGFAKGYTDFRIMLEQERPDAVILATPFQYTAQVAVAVIDFGCHIMMEKPPGKDFDEALAIADAVKRKSPINMVAFNRRNAPMVKKLMELLYGDNPLRVQHIDYQMYRYDRREAHFHTTAIHGIDMIGHIARSPYERLHIEYAQQKQYGEGAENLLLQGCFQNGITTQQSYCPLSGLIMERLTIAADDMTLYAETPIWHGPDFPGVIKVYSKGVLTQVISGNELSSGQTLFETDGFYDQLREFLDCVKQNRPCANDIYSALGSAKIADCLGAHRTAYQG